VSASKDTVLAALNADAATLRVGVVEAFVRCITHHHHPPPPTTPAPPFRMLQNMYDRCRAQSDTQQRALEAADGDLTSTRTALATANTRAADLARVLEETQAALHAQIELKTQEASAATRAVMELRSVVAALQDRVAGLERDVVVRDGRIAELTAAVTDRDAALVAQGADMAVLKAQ